MFQGIFKSVSRKIEGCSERPLRGVSRELLGYSKKFKVCFKAVTKLFTFTEVKV